MRLHIQHLFCILIIFVCIPVGTWSQGWGGGGGAQAPRGDDVLSRYAVDVIQMITGCFSRRNFERPLRFGRCFLNQFTSSDIKQALIYPKLKQAIRTIMNRTVAAENTLQYKIINKYLNRQFMSRPRQPRYGYNDYGGGGGGGGYGDTNRYDTTNNNYDDNNNNNYP